MLTSSVKVRTSARSARRSGRRSSARAGGVGGVERGKGFPERPGQGDAGQRIAAAHAGLAAHHLKELREGGAVRPGGGEDEGVEVRPLHLRGKQRRAARQTGADELALALDVGGDHGVHVTQNPAVLLLIERLEEQRAREVQLARSHRVNVLLRGENFRRAAPERRGDGGVEQRLVKRFRAQNHVGVGVRRGRRDRLMVSRRDALADGFLLQLADDAAEREDGQGAGAQNEPVGRGALDVQALLDDLRVVLGGFAQAGRQG